MIIVNCFVGIIIVHDHLILTLTWFLVNDIDWNVSSLQHLKYLSKFVKLLKSTIKMANTSGIYRLQVLIKDDKLYFKAYLYLQIQSLETLNSSIQNMSGTILENWSIFVEKIACYQAYLRLIKINWLVGISVRYKLQIQRWYIIGKSFWTLVLSSRKEKCNNRSAYWLVFGVFIVFSFRY